MAFFEYVKLREAPGAFRYSAWLMPGIIALSVLPFLAVLVRSMLFFDISGLLYPLSIALGILIYILGDTYMKRKIERNGVGGGSLSLCASNLGVEIAAKAVPAGERRKGWFYVCSPGLMLSGYLPEKNEIGSVLKSDKNGEYVELPTGYSPMLPGVSMPYVKFHASHEEFRKAYGKMTGWK